MAKNSDINVIEYETVLKARMSDDEALKQIFSFYKNYIRILSNKYYLAGAESEDLVQEGMIGLFKAIKDYSPDEGSSFNTYATLCIVRQVKSAIRAANRKKHLPLNTSLSLQEVNDDNKELAELFGENSSDPEKIYINNEICAQANRLIYNSLTKLELRILLLYNKGLSYKEISEISGKSVKSVDNAVQRIKKKVEKIREEYMSL